MTNIFPKDFFTRNYSSQPTSANALASMLEDPGFGRYFTDHMVVITYTEGKGWHSGEVKPFGPITLLPTAGVLHYGQEIFEGLKAYRSEDGSIITFRPDQNAKRLGLSAQRLAMPELPEELFLRSLEELIAVDHAWVPQAGGEAALYVRPIVYASEPVLGIRPAHEYTYLVFGSPSAPFFAGGATKPVSVLVSYDYVRAAPGGTGAAKCGGNYAASLVASAQAKEKGCDQVIWLDALERKYVEEMGGMNLFFVYGDVVVTPELSGSLLAGITRDSIIQLARDKGYSVTEAKISIESVYADLASGKLTEVFACGTAAVVAAVGTIVDKDKVYNISETMGPVTADLRAGLTAIQRGEAPDNHNWRYTLLSNVSVDAA